MDYYSMIDAEIKKQIELGKKEFVIYPFGTLGEMTKDILNNQYGIQEKFIIDNDLSQRKKNIKSLSYLKNIECTKYTFLIASNNRNIYEEIRSLIKEYVLVENLVDIFPNVEINKMEYFNFDTPACKIEKCNKTELQDIIDLTIQTWEKLGNDQPYWSVVTHETYKSENINKLGIKQFYKSGENNAKSLISTLIRNNIILNSIDARKLDIIELGCGVGRVTSHLIHYFKKVLAVDISSGNLKIAQNYLADANNVDFLQIKDINEYNNLPPTDVVYSIMVLQHNPPPIIEFMLLCILKSLRNGGIAFIQLPTYKKNYKFTVADYLKNGGKQMEMHMLEQKSIFSIANKANCIPYEVYQDGWTGGDDFSTTFVFRKL